MHFRKIPMVATIAMLAVCSAAGQSLTDKVSVAYSLQPRPQVTITNRYSSPITGMVMTVSTKVPPYRTKQVIWLDSGVTFKHDPPLPSGQSRSYGVGPVDQAPSLQAQLMAIEFEDGTSAGDPQWLPKLHLRRKVAYAEIGVITALLNKALTEHQPNEQIVSALNDMERSLGASFVEVEARGVAGLVISTTVSNLEHGGITGDIGNPQTTIPATIFPLFAQWREALKRYDKNIS